MTSDKPVIYTTDRLIIREPIRADAIALYKNYTNDPEVTKYLTWVPHKGQVETEKWIEFCITNATTEKSITRVIGRQSSNRNV